MNNLASDTNLSHVPSPGKGRQIDEWVDRNAFISSWRQKVAEESGHIHHVAESFDAGQLGYASDAIGTNELSPLSLPCELRALMPSTPSLNIGGLNGGPAHPHPTLPVPIDTPPAVAVPSSTPGLHHVSVASMPRSPNADLEPARVVASASSELSPGTYPTFAAFLEAALVERARVLTTEPNDANITSSQLPTQRSSIAPSSPSSRVPAYPQADCGHSQCIRATERIRDIRCLQQAFAIFNMAAHPITRDLDRAAAAARRVLSTCLRDRTIATIRECLVLLHQMGSAHNQGLHVLFYAVCSCTGFDPATLPALTGVPLPPNWPHWQVHVRGVVGHAAGGNVYT